MKNIAEHKKIPLYDNGEVAHLKHFLDFKRDVMLREPDPEFIVYFNCENDLLLFAKTTILRTFGNDTEAIKKLYKTDEDCEMNMILGMRIEISEVVEEAHILLTRQKDPLATMRLDPITKKTTILEEKES